MSGNKNVVGTLVVALPTRHEGGQLVLRQGMKEWALDFADVFATATEPLVCFVAFSGEVEQQVLPITSGYRVTLTYNLYGKTSFPSASSFPTPLHEQIKKTLVEFINNKSTLPEGGYLCSGLGHKYDYLDKPISAILDQLKGVDQILAKICEELGLPHFLTLLYQYAEHHLIIRNKYAVRLERDGRGYSTDFVSDALEHSTIEDVEGVEVIGEWFDHNIVEEPDDYDADFAFLLRFYRNPVTKFLKIPNMPTEEITILWPFLGKYEPDEYMVGKACMLIAVDPVASRKQLVL